MFYLTCQFDNLLVQFTDIFWIVILLLNAVFAQLILILIIFRFYVFFILSIFPIYAILFRISFFTTWDVSIIRVFICQLCIRRKWHAILSTIFFIILQISMFFLPICLIFITLFIRQRLIIIITLPSILLLINLLILSQQYPHLLFQIFRRHLKPFYHTNRILKQLLIVIISFLNISFLLFFCLLILN